ncbi:hypothetical protein [Wukongibacter sp. M2B1]|uniref:hypothetical protein n=1 Tax=Wukongibacter sp. M2B1 TaxID=3088895 RepID=UPI003D7A47AB
MKKKFVISFILIVIIANFVVITPKNYLSYVFYNIENKNYKVIDYLKSDEKEALKEIYLYAENYKYSKPQYFITKANPKEYSVILIADLYSKEEDNYGEQIGRHSIRLNIIVDNNGFLIPKIENVKIIDRSTD